MDKANEIIENEIQPSIDMNSLYMEGFTGSRAMLMVIIFQAYGGPDQNFTFLRNRIAAISFFLLSGADHSIFFCGCPGESYRIFCERTMSILNIPVINCSFTLYYSALTEDEAWFIKEIMKKTSTMTDT